MSKLTLTLFGPPAITLDNQFLHVGRRKAVALLAYLAVTGRRPGANKLAPNLYPPSVPVYIVTPPGLC